MQEAKLPERTPGETLYRLLGVTPSLLFWTFASYNALYWLEKLVEGSLTFPDRANATLLPLFWCLIALGGASAFVVAWLTLRRRVSLVWQILYLAIGPLACAMTLGD